MRKRLFIGMLSAIVIPTIAVVSCANGTTKRTGDDKGSNGTNYKDPKNLKSADKWWNIVNNNYGTTVKLKDNGKYFYTKTKKDSNNKYPAKSLSSWIDTYDTEFNNILSDPNHQYASSAPTNYNSTLKGSWDIYENGKNTNLSYSGNNNNGLNGLYSGMTFWMNGKTKLYDSNYAESYNAGIIDLTNNPKKRRIFNSWEHVTPASTIGHAFGEHRRNKITNEFKTATGDLHNLRPSIHEYFNQPRSNYHYGMVPGDNHKNTTGIDFEVGNNSFGLTVCEPRVSVRGDIARILFYMHDRYHVRYEKNYYKLLLLWARMDPVTPEELELDKRITNVMGFHNEYVTGTKRLPYDKDVEEMVKKANSDNTPNAYNPGRTTSTIY